MIFLALVGVAALIYFAGDKAEPQAIPESFDLRSINLAVEDQTKYLWKLTGGGIVSYIVLNAER